MYDDDNDDVRPPREASDEVMLAGSMNLEDLEVEDAEGDEDEPVFITFTDGDITVTLREEDLSGLDDAFMKAWQSYCEAGSACAAEDRAERAYFYSA